MSVIGKVDCEDLFYCILVLFEGEIAFLPHNTILPDSPYLEIIGIFPCTIQDSVEDLF